MNRSNSNMDGFVLRRRPASSNMSSPRPATPSSHSVPDRFLIDPAKRVEPRSNPAPLLRRNAAPGSKGESLALPAPSRERLDIDLTLEDTKPVAKNQKVRKPRSRKKMAS